MNQKDVIASIRLFILGMLILILTKIFDIFFPNPVSVNYPNYVILYPTCGLCCVWASVRSKQSAIVACAAFFVFLVLITLSGVYFKSTFLVETWKFAFWPARYDKCEQSATPYGNGNALALCEDYDRGGYADGIAFDSSDEISLPLEMRSAAWLNVAQGNPMLDQFDFTARKISGHFYYVIFDLTGSPPFIRLEDRK